MWKKHRIKPIDADLLKSILRTYGHLRDDTQDRCKECSKPLSSYNYADICWSHIEHPGYKGESVEWETKNKFNCSSHTPAGLVRAIIDYYGEPHDL